VSEAFLVHSNAYEGEYLGGVCLKKSSWKGEPKKVIALYLKNTSRSLLFFLSTSRNESLEGIRQNYSVKAKYPMSPIVN
jgi:hypothetical protein